MERLSNTVFFVLLAGMLGLVACGGSGSSESEEMTEGEQGVLVDAPPPASAESVAAAQRLSARLENSNAELVSTQRGVVDIGYTQPRATRESNFIVTTFMVQNRAANAIAGFQVDEFWFDVDGNTVTGDRVRFREPILAGEVVEIELRVPRISAMDRSNYEFSHQNGDIEPELVVDDEVVDTWPEFIKPEPEEESEEGEEGEEEAAPAAQ
jgi:hypothetical protein